MVAYLGLLLFFAALSLGDLSLFGVGLLIVLGYAVFDLLWTYWREKTWYFPLSSLISGLVLANVALPKPPLVLLVVLPLLAVASKHLIHLGKSRHIFNPAAFALAIASFVTPVSSWWGPAAGQMPAPLWLFMVGAAVIILWRQRRWHVTLPFVVSYAFFISVTSLLGGVTLNHLPNLLWLQIVNNSIVLFFATVMLIEPRTSTFQTKRQEILYGAIVGLAVTAFTYFTQRFNLPNLDTLVFGLLSGNLVASLLFLPHREQAAVAAFKPIPPATPDEPSFWFRAVPDAPRFSKLQGDIQADVIIIGGGMAGMSAAYFLATSGRKVVLLEANTIASGDTGYTTACATRFLDTLEATLKGWEYSEAAISLLRKTIADENIACQWQDVSATCFTRSNKRVARAHFSETVKQLQAKDASIEYLEKTEASAAMGFAVEAAYRKKDSEGIFHIRQFLHGLAERAVTHGAQFFEKSEVLDITRGESVIVKTAEGSVTAPWLVVATGLPLAKFFPAVAKRLRQSVSYVIDVIFPKKPIWPAGFFWDDIEPYHYGRSTGANEWLLGGEDWKTDEPKPSKNPHTQLEKWLKDVIGKVIPFTVVNGWQGSLFSTPDTLPLVGPYPDYGKNVIFLSGWNGNGMAQGFFAGHMASDLVGNQQNAYYGLLACERAAAWPEIAAKVTSGGQRIPDLAEDKGVIIEVDGQKLAVVKKNGEIKAFSNVCPHLGCAVDWNDNLNTWDCPCHGSRFAADGSLQRGPATRGLDPVKVKIHDDRVEIV